MIGKVEKRWFIGIPQPRRRRALIVGMIWVKPPATKRLPAVEWLCLLVTLFAGLSMVVQIPFWSFKEIANVRRKVPFVAMSFASHAGVLLVVAMEPSLILFLFFLGYSLSGYTMFGLAPSQTAAAAGKSPKNKPQPLLLQSGFFAV